MHQNMEQGCFSCAVYSHNARFVVSVYMKIRIFIDDFQSKGEIHVCSFHDCISLLAFLYNLYSCVLFKGFFYSSILYS